MISLSGWSLLSRQCQQPELQEEGASCAGESVRGNQSWESEILAGNEMEICENVSRTC